MATAVNVITILAMLAHAVAGCCWHHDHEGTCETHVHGAIVVDHDGEAHGHFHSEAVEECAEDNEGHPAIVMRGIHDDAAACSDGQCVFLKSQPRTWSTAPVATTLDAAMTAESASAAPRPRGAPLTCSRLPRDSAVSLCAQLQVWLI